MVDDTNAFALVSILTVAGLGVMLYGVYLTQGEELNVPMGAGGAILLVAVGVLTFWLMSLDEDHAGG